MKHIFKVQRERDGAVRLVRDESKHSAVARAFPKSSRAEGDVYWVLCITSNGKSERCSPAAL